MFRWWQRWKYWLHDTHGGILKELHPHGVIYWRCWCGTVVGRSDLSVSPPKHFARRSDRE